MSSIDSTRPGYFQKHRGKVTEEHVLKGVRSGLLFGAVEVDIEVPDRWSPEFQEGTVTEAIGKHMQN